MPKLTEMPVVQATGAAITSTRLLRPLAARLARLGALLRLVRQAPKNWLLGPLAGQQTAHTLMGGNGQQSEENTLALKTCEDYTELVKAWEAAAEWHPGLDSALAVMLASSMSTEFLGEQLWFKIIGPASSYKTSLMEGLATAVKWYFSRDTIRGFHSGAKAQSETDLPLADLVKGRTLGTKDGDTLLKAPNLQQILSEARALYDKVSRTNYRNFVNREYMGHRMTWHLAGTSAIREIDDSELGARFLDVVIMDKITDEFEARVSKRAARQEAQNMLSLSNGRPEGQYPPDLANAMAMTGGYLDFLRTNALELTKQIAVSDRLLDRCSDFGKFVAFMRARYNREENTEREFSPRLTKQLTRLMIAQAAVLGQTKTDDETIARVHKVMLDTSQGPTLEMLRIMGDRPQGIEVRSLCILMGTSSEKIFKQLKFLRKLGVLETDVNWKRWRVTPTMTKLWNEVKNA